MPGRMTICNMTIEGGGRAGHDRAGRGRPSSTSAANAKGRRRTSTPPWPAGSSLPTEDGATFDQELEVDAGGDLADGHLGHQPGHGRPGHRHGPPTPPRWSPPRRPRIGRTGAHLHGPRGGHADDRGRPRTRLHRFLHQLTDRGPARGGDDRRRAARSPRASRRWSSPAPSRSKPPPKPRGCTRSSAAPASNGARRAARCAWG